MKVSTPRPLRRIFTTGQVAKICQVAPRTASKWFDSGRLGGYRIPGSNDRRIPCDCLVRFLHEHNMPTHGLENEIWRNILLLGCSSQVVHLLQSYLSEEEGWRLHDTSDVFMQGPRWVLLPPTR